MKILKILTTFLAAPLFAVAQEATDILDQTAKALKKANGIEAYFEATSFKGTVEQATTTGTIYLKDEKFKIDSPNGLIWFDGKTQWSLYTNSDEVNITNPTPEELQSINPYTFIYLYKHGYKATSWTTNYDGKSCHQIQLTAQDKNKALREMRIIIDKQTLLPYSIRLKQKNDWFRARIKKIKTHKKLQNKDFQFNTKDYPNVEVIDLR